MKKYILFGAGDYGKKALNFYGAANVAFFVDNNAKKANKTISGKDILDFQSYLAIQKNYVTVISSSFVSEIAKQLQDNGISDYLYYSPAYEHFNRNISDFTDKHMVHNVALFGVDEYTEQLLTNIAMLGLEQKVSAVAVPDDDEAIGQNIGRFEIIPLSKAPQNIDCFIVTNSYYHASHRVLLQQSKENILVFDPFRIRKFYDTPSLIHNPYKDCDIEQNESDWNNFVASQNKDAVNIYAAQAYKKVQLFEYVEIETYNRCNGGCSFCPVSKNVDTRPLAKMPTELFENIIDQLHNLNYDGSLALFSNNEPFLDERIFEFHSYARKQLPNAKMHLFTNGTLLTVEKFVEIMKYLDELIIDNYRQDLQLIKPCREIKDYVENHPEYLSRVTISIRKPNEILTSRGGDAPNRKELMSYGNDRCALPFEQLIIRPDGKISLCCNDPLGKVTLGDLNHETLTEVWYGDKYNSVRQALIKGRGELAHCKYCDTFYLY